MKTKKKLPVMITVTLIILLLIPAGFFAYLSGDNWGFARSVSIVEQLHRLSVVHTAQKWYGTQEGFENHEKILNIYNNHKPLAQGYAVTMDDSWCATFVSCVAIEQAYTGIIPTECSCERQIGLWQSLGRWEENDDYLPLPGDYIYYDWDAKTTSGDSTGWSDHVGIVVGTIGPFIKVIEGNKDDSVAYRIILRGNYQIRGFGLPDYTGKFA